MSETNLIPNLKTSWIGNTWGGGSSWMQDYIDDMVVDANGHCWTYSGWDEGHSERGEYYFDGQWKMIPHGSNDVPRVSSKTVILNNITWNINPDGSVTGNGQTLPSVTKATALGIYIPLNLLIVADDGVGQHVIKFFNTNNAPSLIAILGTLGGITAGNPGEVTKTKFWGLNGVGSDSSGNLYVAMSQEGVILRRYAPLSIPNLIFDVDDVQEAYGMHFMDAACFDPTKNGLEVWGKNERYILDYSLPVGKQWKLVGYTIDKDNYPTDPRLVDSNPGGVKIKYKNGVKFLFFLNQNKQQVTIYKFNGDIAVPFLTVNDLIVNVDDNCDLWFLTGENIDVMRCAGITNGNLVYTPRTNYCPFPAPFTKVTQFLYDAQHDIMYLGGGTKEHPTQGWGHMGPLVCRYNNWSTTKDLVWEIQIPFYHNEAPVSERIVPISWDFAGEYLYIGYLVFDDAQRFDSPYNDCPGPIRVYRIKDGSFVGRLLPDQNVFYGSSWLDINHAISAIETVSGEQLIIREEDWKNKNILYRFCPNGNCTPTKITKVNLIKNSAGNTFLNTSNISFSVTPFVSSGGINKVELYANNQFLGFSTTLPYNFSVTNLPVGPEVTFQAVAFDEDGNKGYSNRIYVKISDGTPEVKILSPVKNSSFLRTDQIIINVSAVDYNGSVSKVELFANGNKIGETTGSSFAWSNLPVGNVNLSAKVTDNNGNIGNSLIVPITIADARPADVTQNPVQGVRYRYYENKYSTLPNFDTISSSDMGSQWDFSLTKKTREESYAFRFDGYLKIDVAGLYTFYTASDDGSKFYIGNTLIVDNDGTHGTKEENGRILLQAGYHKFTLDYAQGEGGAELKTYWEGPNIVKQPIPSSILFFEPASLICPVPITNVTLSKTNINVAERNGVTVLATVNPNNTCSKKIVWSSSNSNVATVENGVVTGKSVGNAIIKATSADPAIFATCDVSVTSNSLPSPWGLHSISTNATASFANNELTLTSGGIDIWGGFDEFGFVNQLIEGNATLITRIASLSRANEWTKAGLMFRTGISGSNAFFALMKTSDHGLQVGWRASENGFVEGPTFENLSVMPVFLKIERVGNVFTGYYSTDGNNWNVVASKTLSLPNTLRVGLIATAHENGPNTTAKFSNISLNGATPPPVDPPTTVPATGVTINLTSLQLIKGASAILVSTVVPSNATNKNVTWSSSNSNVANVNNGNVTAINTGNAIITVATQDGNFTATSNITVIPQPSMNPRDPENPTNTTQGLDFEYYEQSIIESLPNFDVLTPVNSGNKNYFDLSGSRAENFAFRYKGFIDVPTEGLYKFYTKSDDGSKLYIGNQEIVNNDGMHGSIEKSGEISLKAGKHALIVTFFQRGAGAELVVSYEGPGINKQAIPQSVLYRALPLPPPVPGAKVVKAASRRTHGAKGNFDIALSIDPNDPISSIPVECRSGTKQAIYLEFDKPIISAGIVLETVAGKKALLESFIQHDEKSFTINLNTVSDAQLLKIHLNDITDLAGNKSSALLRMRILIGDIDGDGIVSQSDKNLMESYLWANERSFRADINNSGGFTDIDLQAVKNRLGWKI